jgi:hypothetical protein
MPKVGVQSAIPMQRQYMTVCKKPELKILKQREAWTEMDIAETMQRMRIILSSYTVLS